ncbi:hypothetical protein TYRP_004811, partial [Tyrophagus putrescentiae]
MPKNKNKSCYKKVLFRCGRTFVHSYKFVRVKNNDNLSDNDILVAQCTLRTAFFDCLKSKASNCNKRKANEMSGKVKRNGKKIAKHDDGLDVPGMEKTGKNSTTSTENFEKHLRTSRRAILIALVRRDQSFGGLSAWNSWASLAELAARNLLISMMFQSVRQCVWQVSLWLSRSKGARSNDASSSALPRVQAEEIGSALRRIYMYPSSRDSDLFCKIIGN